MEFDESDAEEAEPKQVTTPPRSRAARRAAERETLSGKKPKAAARHKGGKKGSSRACEACMKVKPCEEFALNQANCMECKAALDNISKKARKQKQTEWLTNTLEDPAAKKAMLESYFAAMKMASADGPTRGGNRKEAWSLIEYIEIVKSTSKIKKTGRDQLMWKLQAIEHWKSVAGGAKSQAEAERKWNDMEANFAEFDHDHEGPEGSTLRLPVRVADFVDTSDSYARSKPLP